MFYDFYVKHFKLENDLSYGHGTKCNGIIDLENWVKVKGQGHIKQQKIPFFLSFFLHVMPLIEDMDKYSLPDCFQFN